MSDTQWTEIFKYVILTSAVQDVKVKQRGWWKCKDDFIILNHGGVFTPLRLDTAWRALHLLLRSSVPKPRSNNHVTIHVPYLLNPNQNAAPIYWKNFSTDGTWFRWLWFQVHFDVSVICSLYLIWLITWRVKEAAIVSWHLLVLSLLLRFIPYHNRITLNDCFK